MIAECIGFMLEKKIPLHHGPQGAGFKIKQTLNNFLYIYVPVCTKLKTKICKNCMED